MQKVQVLGFSWCEGSQALECIFAHPSIKECVCGSLWKQYLILSTCHSPSACPALRASIPVLMIYVSVRVPATKTLLDNDLLSLTRRKYNQVIVFIQNILHSLKILIDIAEKKVIFLSPGIDFSSQWEEWTAVGPLFWQTLSICAKSDGINRYPWNCSKGM